MAIQVTNGDFLAAIDGDTNDASDRIGDHAFFVDEAISFSGVMAPQSNFSLVSGLPGQGSGGGATYFANGTSTIDFEDFVWTVAPTANDQDAGNQKNNALNSGAGVRMVNGTIRVTRTDPARIWAFGSTSAANTPLEVENLVVQAENARFIAQLGEFTSAASINGWSIDDFTFANARADWNVKADATYTGLSSGVFNTETVETRNGNMSGSAGTGVTGTTTLDGYSNRRNASLVGGEETEPNFAHFISPKANYFTFVDPIYLLRNQTTGIFTASDVSTDEHINQWWRFASSTDGTASQRAQVGTGMVIGRRFSVTGVNALGGVVPGIETWITNAANTAFDTTTSFLANGITATDSPDGNGRPVGNPQTLNSPLTNGATAFIVSDEVAQIQSTGTVGFNHAILPLGNFSFRTRSEGYAPIDRVNVSSRMVEPVTNLSWEGLDWVIPDTLGTTNSTNHLASLGHAAYNQSPLSGVSFTVVGSTLVGTGLDIDIAGTGAVQGFTINTGGVNDVMTFTEGPILETNATVPVWNPLGSVAVIDTLEGNINILNDVQTVGTVDLRGAININAAVNNFVDFRIEGTINDLRDNVANNLILTGPTTINFAIPGDTYTYAQLFGAQGLDTAALTLNDNPLGDDLSINSANPITITLTTAEAESLGKFGIVPGGAAQVDDFVSYSVPAIITTETITFPQIDGYYSIRQTIGGTTTVHTGVTRLLAADAALVVTFDSTLFAAADTLEVRYKTDSVLGDQETIYLEEAHTHVFNSGSTVITAQAGQGYPVRNAGTPLANETFTIDSSSGTCLTTITNTAAEASLTVLSGRALAVGIQVMNTEEWFTCYHNDAADSSVGAEFQDNNAISWNTSRITFQSGNVAASSLPLAGGGGDADVQAPIVHSLQGWASDGSGTFANARAGVAEIDGRLSGTASTEQTEAAVSSVISRRRLANKTDIANAANTGQVFEGGVVPVDTTV